MFCRLRFANVHHLPILYIYLRKANVNPLHLPGSDPGRHSLPARSATGPSGPIKFPFLASSTPTRNNKSPEKKNPMKEDLVRNESDGYMRMAWHTDLQKTLGGRTNRGGLVARADPVIVVQGSPPGKILTLICLEINGSVACRVR